MAATRDAVSWQARVFGAAIKVLVRREHWGSGRALARRARLVFGAPRPYGWLRTRGLMIRPRKQDQVRGEWIEAARHSDDVILYVHGGGFDNVVGAASIAVAGDSAGGGLTLSLLLRARDEGLPLPACGVCFSPWLDLTGSGASVLEDNGRCAMFRPRNVPDFARTYLGDVAPAERYASPALAELSGLPPLLLQVGAPELLLDDAVRTHEKVRAAGGVSELEVYHGMFHGWHMLDGIVPEAREALARAAVFIRRHVYLLRDKVMLYMVIERFRNRDGAAVYARFRERGRMAPEGVEYVDSWVEPNLDRCFQLMRSESVALLEQWAANWRDLVDFEFVPVVHGSEMARRFAPPEVP